MFILKIKETNPEEGNFLIELYLNLEVGDPNVSFLRDERNGLHELIVSYKLIFLNKYYILSMDISREGAKNQMVFRHESF